ncbi:hypothetical protein CGZ90_13605 [Fictibacillus aquaticus]|uniref:SH3b domain-containing protein n=1 Tax=Fictibacillus aquaticus TaxID=2021314 RepID=A0A235F9D4_9BACL|nr:SH3 domain-containing protein [Fictibacillus aquaticus]OYD57694.1 hypothetical protein CGZ90_13605 [Fictibacillus aquaticus]
MENLLNQLFWLYAPLTFLPEWARIAIVTFISILLIRPLLLSWLPKLLKIAAIILSKVVELISSPFMMIINNVQKKRRAAGNIYNPFWVDWIEGFFSFFMFIFKKIELLALKKPKNPMRIKKWTRNIAILAAILFSLAITNGPTESYSMKWKEFDYYMTVDKLYRELGFSAAETTASFETEAEEASTSGIRLTLNETYKSGGNVRSGPSLSSKAVDDLVWGEEVAYLDEKSEDSEGRTWLKVRTKEGIIGWVSSKIMKRA